jgi:hypothetical protein
LLVEANMNPQTQNVAQSDAQRDRQADLEWAVANTKGCGSKMSCIKHGTCLGRPICKARGAMGYTAGFVEPTESSEHCGYCVQTYRGHACFCPTRWALYRAQTTPI